MRDINVITLVQLSFQVWQANHNGQVIPYISRVQPQSFTHEIRGTKSSSRRLLTFDVEDTLPFKAIEILGEASAIGCKEMPLDCEHKQGIELIEGVEKREKVSGASMGCDGEEVA